MDIFLDSLGRQSNDNLILYHHLILSRITLRTDIVAV